MSRTSIAVALVALGTAALWYLAKPPLSDHGYDERARQTLGSLSSQVQTARLWGRELDRGDTPLVTARVGLEEVSSDATGTIDQFARYQPPDERTDLRTRVDSLGQRVVTALGELRVEALAGDRESVIHDAGRLGALVDALDAARGQVG